MDVCPVNHGDDTLGWLARLRKSREDGMMRPVGDVMALKTSTRRLRPNRGNQKIGELAGVLGRQRNRDVTDLYAMPRLAHQPARTAARMLLVSKDHLIAELSIRSRRRRC